MRVHRSHFREWVDLMSPVQVNRLDKLSLMHPFVISSNDGSLGRRLGEQDNSKHNVDYWGEVLATDIFPIGKFDPLLFYQYIIDAGFKGIGFYPYWESTQIKDVMLVGGFHVDSRPQQRLSTWAQLERKGSYVSIHEGFEYYNKKQKL